MNQCLGIVAADHVFADAFWNRMTVTLAFMVPDHDKTGSSGFSHIFRIKLDVLRFHLFKALLNNSGQRNGLGNIEGCTSDVFVENAGDDLVADKSGGAHQQNQQAHHQQQHSCSQRTRHDFLKTLDG